MNEASQTITLKVQITPNVGKADNLAKTQSAYTEAVNYFIQKADALKTTKRARLNAETYQEAIGRFGLNSSTLQAAMLKALAAYRSMISHRAKKHKAGLPAFKCPLPFMVRQDRWRIAHTKKGNPVLLLSFLPGKSQTAYPLADCEPLHQKLADLQAGRCRQGSAEVWQGKDGCWYAALCLVYPTQAASPKDWLGVDLGIVHHAVAATAEGKYVMVFDGKPARWRKERWSERRQALQERGRLSRVRREQGREARWTKSINHAISRKLVNKAKAEGFGLALEQLAGIRSRTRRGKKFNRMIAGWPFDQLGQFISYKAALAGLSVKWVDPRHTSSICPRCGTIDGASRKTQALFACKHCGYTALADHVGARNIARRASMPGGLDSPGKGSVAPLTATGQVDSGSLGAG